MPPFPAQDRLIRKETAIGVLREMEPPKTHIGVRLLAPMKEVMSDDVIFAHIKGEADGLVPARAEDAESELARKDDVIFTEGRASVVDWAIKDNYTASDITKYTEAVYLEQMIRGANLPTSFPLTVGSMAEEARQRFARDDRRRRRKVDNRLEWLVWQAMETGGIAYDDGKIKFSVSFDRPANQQDEAPIATWNLAGSDPIRDILNMQTFMYDTYGVRMTRAITSRKVLANSLNSDKFAARSGLAGGTGSLPVDPMYLIDGWGPEAAKAVIERATGVKFIEYDAVYRTRALGSTTFVNNRFFSENKILFLPSQEDLDEIDDMVGFGATLTSPHPEGNWTPGFYEWEKERSDPWGRDRGVGIKAFPIFPHLDKTYTMTVLP